MPLNCGVGVDSWESLGQQGYPTSPSYRKSVLNIHWKDWCWSWNSSTLAAWCKELTDWKRPWCWERLKAGGEGDDRGWDGWMASLTQWTWVWVNSRSWWWTGRPSLARCSPWDPKSRTRLSDWTELNWTKPRHHWIVLFVCFKERRLSWIQQGTRTSANHIKWVWTSSFPRHLLMSILQVYDLPPPLPPPVSNSSCLFMPAPVCQLLFSHTFQGIFL